ncbi:MAG TPA: FG-GAP-like repeat-containing protein, partial [Pyrinomonadaceae bacterium]
VVATDLDNDGRLDVVVAHQIACHTSPCIVGRTISVMLGLGDGTFQPAREIEVGTGMSSIAVGDFNRDGLKDLGIAGDSSQIYILLGLGDGTFIKQPTIMPITEGNLGVDGTDIDVADFNGDTIQDLAVALALNGSRTVILTGNGDGTFREPLIITEPGTRVPQYQAVADYNGDGFQDIALSLGWGLQGWMEILHGNGDGSFQQPVMYLVPDPKSSTSGGTLLSADFNNDGKPDIALQFVGAIAGTLALRNTTGVTPPRPQPTPRAPVLNSPANGATVSQPVTFDWSDVAGAVSYRIQIDDESRFSSPQVAGATVKVSAFTSNSLPAKRLWWRVQGVNSAGVSGPWSAASRFTPQSTSPQPGSTALSALALSPAALVGGNSSQGMVTLTSAAPSGGATVTLVSSNTAAATVPATVTVAAGATSANFTVTTKSVTASTAVTITASFGGVSRTATLTLTPPSPPPPPPPPPSGTLTLTVTATGRGGERVTSSPSGINVAVGSTGTASFATGTAITLSVTNGRDAVWSGACSSGGNKTKTCRFTPTGNASVTANVQ